MRILITNDDSISAAQLPNLIRWCQKLGDVTVVVPEYEQSGKSHGIQLLQAFKAEKRILEGIEVWAVDSTPADCVRFAVLGLHMEFDLVISGINRGCNMGLDVMYSGTVAAIFEAAALGIPAIALSVPYPNYQNAADHLDMVGDYCTQHRLLERHTLYNVNIPVDPKGVYITRQGGPYYTDDFDPRENNLYMPVGRCVHENTGDLTLDTDCVVSGYVSITPMTLSRTDMEVFKQLSEK